MIKRKLKSASLFTHEPRNGCQFICAFWFFAFALSITGCSENEEFDDPVSEFVVSDAPVLPLDSWCDTPRADEGDIDGIDVLAVICPNVVFGIDDGMRVFFNLTTQETAAVDFHAKDHNVIDFDEEKITYLGLLAIERYYYREGKIARLYRGETVDKEHHLDAKDAAVLDDGTIMLGGIIDSERRSFLLNPNTLEIRETSLAVDIIDIDGNLLQTIDHVYQYTDGEFELLARDYGNYTQYTRTVNSELRTALYSCVNPPTHWICEIDIDTKRSREFPGLYAWQFGYIDNAVIGFDFDDNLIGWVNDQKVIISEGLDDANLFELDRKHWLAEYRNDQDERFIRWGGIDRSGTE